MRSDLRALPGQVTLRNIFISMFFWALWCGALIADFTFRGADALMILCVIPYRFAGPCVAIGALFGRIRIGALVGLVVVGCVVVTIYIWIMHFTDHL
jgi:hypothetical protein